MTTLEFVVMNSGFTEMRALLIVSCLPNFLESHRNMSKRDRHGSGIEKNRRWKSANVVSQNVGLELGTRNMDEVQGSSL